MIANTLQRTNGVPHRPVPAGSVVAVPWRRVRPMPGQPREHFDRRLLEELAQSIGAIGQVVAAKVCQVADDPRCDYELIDGQRRWHAVQIAGVETIRCEVVDEPDPERRFVLSVVANLSRVGHQPLEIAAAYARMNATATQTRIAEVVGKSQNHVSKYLSLNRLHDELKARLRPDCPADGRIPVTAAFDLARLSYSEQLVAIDRIDREGISFLKATKGVVADMIPPTRKAPRRPSQEYESLKSAVSTAHYHMKKFVGDRERFRAVVRARAAGEIGRLIDGLDAVAADAAALADAARSMGIV